MSILIMLTTSQIDNVDTSRLASGEPIAEAVIPPVERAEIIPEVRDSIQLAFRTSFSHLVSRYGGPVTPMSSALRLSL